MAYQLNRHVIEIPDEKDTGSELINMDFFLYPEKRKIIHGTVRFPNGLPAPNSLVMVSKLKKGCIDPDSTSDVVDIGHAITSDTGEFILGPVYPGDIIILKISYIEEQETNEPTIPYRSTHSPEDN